jgi:hypothetical protein
MTTTVEREQTCDLEMGPIADATEPGTAARRREETTTTTIAGPGNDAASTQQQQHIICCMFFLFGLALVSLGVCIEVGTPTAEKICLPIFCSSLILLVCIFGCAAALTDEADKTEGRSSRRVEQESHAKVPVMLSFQPCMTVANL